MTGDFAVRLRGDAVRLVDIRPETRNAIGDEAALRGVSAEKLISDLLDAIARGDQFTTVLAAGVVRDG